MQLLHLFAMLRFHYKSYLKLFQFHGFSTKKNPGMKLPLPSLWQNCIDAGHRLNLHLWRFSKSCCPKSGDLKSTTVLAPVADVNRVRCSDIKAMRFVSTSFFLFFWDIALFSLVCRKMAKQGLVDKSWRPRWPILTICLDFIQLPSCHRALHVVSLVPGNWHEVDLPIFTSIRPKSLNVNNIQWLFSRGVTLHSCEVKLWRPKATNFWILFKICLSYNHRRWMELIDNQKNTLTFENISHQLIKDDLTICSLHSEHFNSKYCKIMRNYTSSLPHYATLVTNHNIRNMQAHKTSRISSHSPITRAPSWSNPALLLDDYGCPVELQPV